jgi:hypothetical protein
MTRKGPTGAVRRLRRLAWKRMERNLHVREAGPGSGPRPSNRGAQGRHPSAATSGSTENRGTGMFEKSDGRLAGRPVLVQQPHAARACQDGAGGEDGEEAHAFHDHVGDEASARPRVVVAPCLRLNVQNRLGRGGMGAGVRREDRSRAEHGLYGPSWQWYSTAYWPATAGHFGSRTIAILSPATAP